MCFYMHEELFTVWSQRVVSCQLNSHPSWHFISFIAAALFPFLCLHLVCVGVRVYGYVCRMHCYNKWGRRGVSVGGRRRRWWLNECICLAVMAWEQIDACSGCEVTCLFPPQPAKKSIREELNRTSEKCSRGRLRYCSENRPRDAGHVEISWKWIPNFKHSHQLLVYLFWNIWR